MSLLFLSLAVCWSPLAAAAALLRARAGGDGAIAVGLALLFVLPLLRGPVLAQRLLLLDGAS